ncbi:hypothetical protein [Arthrobacter sp. ISL-95]|uniref:hypothetical protein n=1 Tax=Arthrobacter sp. ISL-95 TaxID=2819116 RepID=UPI001BEB5803|nr:hypothetical protein [Arthrobacter sp. ISL-95]MBT2585419.1 hypothetical protein [Arthrobacter sp. ISL-95]
MAQDRSIADAAFDMLGQASSSSNQKIELMVASGLARAVNLTHNHSYRFHPPQPRPRGQNDDSS